jgi:hypothetical protein
MALPPYIFDHVDRALAAIVTALKKQRIEGFITVCAEEVQQLEDTLWAMIAERMLASAVGAQLDQYGALVGENRDGLTDDEYRAFIQARIATNASKGEVDTLTSILEVIGRASGPVRYDPLYPAGMQFTYPTASSASAQAAERINAQMLEAAPAGVDIAFIVETTTTPFAFAGDDTEASGFGVGEFGRVI